MNRLDAMADEVNEHLLDLNLVDRDSSQRRIELEIDFDISLSGADQAESNRLLHDFVEAFARAHGLPLLDEIAQAPDDLAGASRLRVRLTHHFLDSPRPRRVDFLQHAAAGPDVIPDPGCRLIELMRQR